MGFPVAPSCRALRNEVTVTGFIRYLHHTHWVVILFGSLLTVVAAYRSRKFNAALLPAYLLFIILMTLMYREAGSGRLRLTLFWSYSRFIRKWRIRKEILNNIWLFIPLGAILYRLIPKWYVVFVTVPLSIAIEAAQYMLDRGLCETDDVVSNVLGGLIGIIVCRGIVSILNYSGHKAT